MKALIVEDNDLYRDVLELVLIESGFRVSIARNGVDGLKILENDLGDAFDLIVTDHQMPFMTGAQLVREVLNKKITYRKLILLAAPVEVNAFIREFVNFDNRIHVIAKDTPITLLKDNHFKI